MADAAGVRRSLNAHVKGVVNAVAGHVLESVRAATPVGTGAARASWKLEAATSDAEPEARVVTDCDYMPDLNAGSSPQAEPGFVRAAVVRAFTEKTS
jgi:hypothetical protein